MSIALEAAIEAAIDREEGRTIPLPHEVERAKRVLAAFLSTASQDREILDKLFWAFVGEADISVKAQRAIPAARAAILALKDIVEG